MPIFPCLPAHQGKASNRSRPRRLYFEPLEDRRVLSAAVGSPVEHNIEPFQDAESSSVDSGLVVSDTGAAAEALLAVWPDVFDVNQVIDLNLQIDPDDLATIRADETFSIEVPALLSADGETPILVAIRRKSGDSLGGKVSYKIDINELVGGQEWRGLKKLSLENGDDEDVVTEGLSWHMHRAAADHLAGNYNPGMAAWINLHINGELEGIYINVEQVDKQFLKNRGMFIDGDTWLYKQSEVGGPPDLKVGTGDSPTSETLSYSPFKNSGKKDPTPDEATLATQLPDLIDMETMLAVGTVNAFSGNLDELFSRGKNFYYADFLLGKRFYFPWDLDAAFSAFNITSNIYGPNLDEYQEIILNHPVFRAQFNEIMLDLLNGPLSPGSLIAFLDQIEPMLTASLNADPNNNIDGTVAEHFDDLRSRVQARHANVLQQVLDDMGVGGMPPVVTVDPLATNDRTPELTGTIDDPAATIDVTVDSNMYAATNNGDGTWTLTDNTINPPLADGVFDVQVSATNAAMLAGSDATNDELTVDATPPTVTAVVRNGGNDNYDELVTLAFTFDEDVSTSFDILDLTLVNISTATPVDLTPASVMWDGGTNTATWDLTGATIEVGFHDITLLAAGLSDALGNPLDGNGDMTGGDDFQTTLLVALPGDTDLDGEVDTTDISNILSANTFENPANWPAEWATGDFSGDGEVTTDDISMILASNAFEKGPYALMTQPAIDASLKPITFSAPGVRMPLVGDVMLKHNLRASQLLVVPVAPVSNQTDSSGDLLWHATNEVLPFEAAKPVYRPLRPIAAAEVDLALEEDPLRKEIWDAALKALLGRDDTSGS